MGPARIDTPLKRILDDEGRRQTWLAARLSEILKRPIDRSEVNRWVNGVHIPEKATRDAIAEALGRTVDELFPPQPDERAAA